jgi:hypothetical protein
MSDKVLEIGMLQIAAAGNAKGVVELTTCALPARHRCQHIVG